MQQSIQRMAGQIQSMQGEVRQLAQMAQQLEQQNMAHFQQMQSMAGTNRHLNEIGGNEQASGMMLHQIAEVCMHMNMHLQNISQQLSGGAQGGMKQGGMQSGMQQNLQQGGLKSGMQQGGMQGGQLGGQALYQTPTYGGQQGMGNQGMSNQGQGMQSGGMTSMTGGNQQNQAPEGPVATDTTHMDRRTVPGVESVYSMSSSQVPSNALIGSGVTDSNNAYAQGGGQSANMSTQTQGGAGSQMSGSTMSAQQPFPGSEADLKHNHNEYREDPKYTKYPFDRLTT
jgi:hypothetical protein